MSKTSIEIKPYRFERLSKHEEAFAARIIAALMHAAEIAEAEGFTLVRLRLRHLCLYLRKLLIDVRLLFYEFQMFTLEHLNLIAEKCELPLRIGNASAAKDRRLESVNQIKQSHGLKQNQRSSKAQVRITIPMQPPTPIGSGAAFQLFLGTTPTQ